MYRDDTVDKALGFFLRFIKTNWIQDFFIPRKVAKNNLK